MVQQFHVPVVFCSIIILEGRIRQIIIIEKRKKSMRSNGKKAIFKPMLEHGLLPVADPGPEIS